MSKPVVALCGGIGGAKLALGLSRLLGAGLTVAVNTGDDFEHLGLHVSPDIDTVLYTLAGIADRERGWGRDGESWNFMEALAGLGGETWFQLGDRDLAMHVRRTSWLRAGGTSTGFVALAAEALGVTTRVLPMSDDPVRTLVETTDGTLPFQRYFVERRCAPVVRRLRFEGAERARPASGLLGAVGAADLRAVVICPSNPYLSIDPILAVPQLRDALRTSAAPVVAVSPLIGGAAVKGPTAKIMRELGIDAGVEAIAAHYDGLIDGLVVDVVDAEAAAAMELPTFATRTLMRTVEDRLALAADVLAFADVLAPAVARARPTVIGAVR